MDCSTPDGSYSDPDSERSDSESIDKAGYETDLTNPADADDLGDLLADNTHPPEYYIQLAEGFNETEDAKEDYSPGTTLLLDRIEGQWLQ
jgi:hypothetical protein